MYALNICIIQIVVSHFSVDNAKCHRDNECDIMRSNAKQNVTVSFDNIALKSPILLLCCFPLFSTASNCRTSYLIARDLYFTKVIWLSIFKLFYWIVHSALYSVKSGEDFLVWTLLQNNEQNKRIVNKTFER